MIDIKNIDLTDADFDLMIQALEALPKSNELDMKMGNIFSSMIVVDNAAEMNRQFLAKIKKNEEEEKAKARIVKEESIILQGKLLMLKRYLAEQSALNEAEGILKTN